jgi:hypothetical protein
VTSSLAMLRALPLRHFLRDPHAPNGRKQPPSRVPAMRPTFAAPATGRSLRPTVCHSSFSEGRY